MKTSKQVYAVIVEYATATLLNPAVARVRVAAESPEQALQLGINKVKGYKKCGKVNGGSVEGFPAPTDWAAEFELMRTKAAKAIEWMGEVLIERGPITLQINEQTSVWLKIINGKVQSNWGNGIVDTDYFELADEQASLVIGLVMRVQKAIAGGHNS